MWFELVQNIIQFCFLSLGVACVARTVCDEEVFCELREFCKRKSETRRVWYGRKFFYLWTCEYCFSHYPTIAVLIRFELRFLWNDWRGVLPAFFTMPLMANFILKKYSEMSVDITLVKADTELKKNEVEQARVTNVATNE